MVVVSSNPHPTTPHTQYPNQGGRGQNRKTKGRRNSRNRGGGNGGCGVAPPGRRYGGAQQQGSWTWVPWQAPPCPYPSQNWARPIYGNLGQSQTGLLGPRPPPPPQAFTASTPPADAT
ncbi:hypothetical protein M5689_006222 [Euphorbia peplus]|nr:hypothetical protein M5689_006222 [Euphorbia peplus]